MARKLSTCALTSAVNASAYATERDEKIRAFLKFVCTNDPGQDEYSNNLFATVEKLKANEKFLLEYAAMNIREMDLVRESKKEQAVEDALVAIKEFGIAPELAAEKMGAPLDKVLEALAAEPAPAN